MGRFLILFTLAAFIGNSLTAGSNDVSDEAEPNDVMDCEICKTEMRRAILAIISLKKSLKESEIRAAKAEKALYELVSGTKIDYEDATGRYNSTTCEGKTAQISCPEGKVLKVESADYGRHDNTTCPHPQIITTDCSTEKAPKLVSEKCNSGKSCDVRATNGVFGDPCVNTYKYLSINFKCIDAPITD